MAEPIGEEEFEACSLWVVPSRKIPLGQAQLAQSMAKALKPLLSGATSALAAPNS